MSPTSPGSKSLADSPKDHQKWKLIHCLCSWYRLLFWDRKEVLSDSMFTLQFLHRAAKEPVAALRLFRSYLHLFSSQGSTEVFSSLCLVVPWRLKDWEGMSTCRRLQSRSKGLAFLDDRKEKFGRIIWMNKQKQEGRELEGSKDHDPTELQMGSSQMITHLSCLSVVRLPRLMWMPTSFLAAGPSSDQVD